MLNVQPRPITASWPTRAPRVQGNEINRSPTLTTAFARQKILLFRVQDGLVDCGAIKESKQWDAIQQIDKLIKR